MKVLIPSDTTSRCLSTSKMKQKIEEKLKKRHKNKDLKLKKTERQKYIN